MKYHFILDPNERGGRHEIHNVDVQCYSPTRPNISTAIDLRWHDNLATAQSYARSNFRSWNIGVCPRCFH